MSKQERKDQFLETTLTMVKDLPDAKLLATNFDGTNLESIIICAISMGREKERYSITKKFGKEMEKLIIKNSK
jgi:hypothetical protein